MRVHLQGVFLVADNSAKTFRKKHGTKELKNIVKMGR
jgi:hypothetical protein